MANTSKFNLPNVLRHMKAPRILDVEGLSLFKDIAMRLTTLTHCILIIMSNPREALKAYQECEEDG